MNLLDQLAINFDLPILDWIAEHLHCGVLDRLMPLITVLGNGGIFWILLSVAFMLIPKYRKAGFSMAIALLMGLLICNLSLKPLVARIRPYDFQLQNFGKSIPLLIAAPHDYSFPSGHTIASFEAAVALLIRNRKLGMGALALAVLIAFSRLYLYVHYPTDVLASVVLGTLLAFIGTGIVNMINNFIQKRKTA
jgi:undecaprenyl-diphosphatase